LVVIALSYGSQEGGPAGQSNFDLNDNGKLRMFDVVTAATNYGKTCNTHKVFLFCLPISTRYHP